MSQPRPLPIAGPSITAREIDYITDAATTGWYGRANEYVERFETAFAQEIGCQFAMALPSCTSAIHLALLAAEIGPGDEVIVPDLTWIASAAPIDYVGATPVFADVDPRSWCLTAASVSAVLSERTRAVIAVDLYGDMPNYAALHELLAGRGILLLEDAAEAVGSRYHNAMAGSLGDVGVFSFHGSKTMTTGEGGMLVTDDATLHQRCQFLRDHGRRPGDKSFFNTEVAYKYKMSNLQAALGLAQTERLDELVTNKRQLFAWYSARLGGLSNLRLNGEAEGVTSSYWMITAVLAPDTPLSGAELAADLAHAGIDTRPFFHPLSSLPAYAEARDTPRARADNHVAYRIAPKGLNLPSAHCLDEADVEAVCTAVRQQIARPRAKQPER